VASGRRRNKRGDERPPINEALERGEQLNLLFEFADDFAGLELNALWEDAKAAGARSSMYIATAVEPNAPAMSMRPSAFRT
jgi:hypothetical protein